MPRKGNFTVFTGYSLVSSDFAVLDLKIGLLAGLPLLVLLVAGTTWVIVGPGCPSRRGFRQRTFRPPPEPRATVPRSSGSLQQRQSSMCT